ncbi:MAG: hypothetical protein SPK50_08370 [Mobiluncus porci]|nr:hypothetical protein [Mobiluncus porci]MDD7542328.1 hypothetical protein [Mobiluncus porci]MDY5749127.1 hypothetical protein [Mobiluncus porci]
MPQLTAQRPKVVTLDRICDALDSTGRNYVVDVYNSRRTVMVPGETATSYIDLVTGVLRVRSVWRGVIDAHQQAELFPYISHHNREAVGPRAVVNDHGDHFHICTQTGLQVAAGMGNQQLEASLLLSLIMLERFTSRLESDFAWTPPPNKYFFHQNLLKKQHVLQMPVGFSDNSTTHPVDADFVEAACGRLQLRVQRDGTVFRLLDSSQGTVLRLFGEDTWMSVSTLVELPRPASAEDLFLAVNGSNWYNCLGTTSIMGMRNHPYLRFDYLISTGEGLSERQLDTQILVGMGVGADLFSHFVNKHPRLFG